MRQRSSSSPDDASASAERDLFDAGRRDVAGVIGASSLAPVDSPPGYSLVGVVGRGGQGVVYEALHLASRRRVALKLMRHEALGTALDRRRVEREIDLVSRIDHPGVVAIRDSVESRSGTWHAMDFVEGAPLDRYLATHHPSLDAAIGLMADVADAVGAAHLRGVIHRDLKPANILVDEQARPHVVDFGLAKDTAPSGGRDQTFTEPGRFVGSLAWSSPEQAEGRSNEVDTRTDVYAMGVILYNALTGVFPYPVDGSLRETLDHIVRTPPTPPRRVRRDLDSETETIILACLQKDPARRYQSAGEFARELRRRLAGQPIAARADSTLYVLRTMLRRHRAGAAVAAAFLVLLAGGAVALAALYRNAAREAQTSREVLQLFTQDLIAGADPLSGSGRDARVTDLIAGAERRIDGRIGDPYAEATIRRALGSIDLALSELDRAEPQLERAVDLFRRSLGENHPESLAAVAELARLRHGQGRFVDAERLARDGLAAGAALGPEQPAVLELQHQLAEALQRQGRYAEAMDVAQRRLRVVRAARPIDDRSLFGAADQAATVLCEMQRYGDAVPIQREALDLAKRLAAGTDDLRTAAAMNNLGVSLLSLSQFDEAQSLLERALAIRREKLGDDHLETVTAVFNLGTLHSHAGRPAEAAPFIGEAWRQRARLLGPEHGETLFARHELGMLRLAQNDLDAADEHLSFVFEARRRQLPADNPFVIDTQRMLGSVRRRQGRLADAENLLRDAHERAGASLGPTANITIGAGAGLAQTLATLGRGDEACALVEQTVAAARSLSADDAMRRFVLRASFGIANEAGCPRTAAVSANELADLIADDQPPRIDEMLRWRIQAAEAFIKANDDDAAEAALGAAEASIGGEVAPTEAPSGASEPDAFAELRERAAKARHSIDERRSHSR